MSSPSHMISMVMRLPRLVLAGTLLLVTCASAARGTQVDFLDRQPIHIPGRGFQIERDLILIHEEIVDRLPIFRLRFSAGHLRRTR